MLRRQFFTWYLLVCLQLLTVAIAVYFDFHITVWTADQTKLSFAIASLWAISTIIIGAWHVITDARRIQDLAKIGWYLAETCLALGMVGTVAGFLLMLGTAFDTIDLSNTASLQAALVDMALGMSTALYTTLMGLIASIYLKSQLVNLESYADGLSRQV
jgi:hypothetical protein